MRFTELKYTERKNLTNYEHSELSATAIIDETEDHNKCLIDLMLFVKEGLHGVQIDPPIKEVESPIKEVVKEEPKTAKKQKKEKVEEPKSEVDSANVPPVIPEVVKEEKPKAAKVVKYDSNIPEHKSLFGGFLQKKYDTKWKTVGTPEEIKKFTSSLNGQDFLDDKGQIVPSFIEQVLTFFGA